MEMDYMLHLVIDESTDAAVKERIIEDLMDAYGTDVWNFAYLLTGSRTQADEAAQDTFWRAYRKLHTFRREASVKTWLLTIARRAAADIRRSAFIRRVMPFAHVPEGILGGTAASAEEEALQRMMASEVWRHVAELPLKQREVLMLHAHYGLKDGEIAAVLRVPEGTVKSRLSAARKRMAESIEREGQRL
jgi:RNA polymerase sigma-70 factor, ECF subfamily